MFYIIKENLININKSNTKIKFIMIFILMIIFIMLITPLLLHYLNNKRIETLADYCYKGDYDNVEKTLLHYPYLVNKRDKFGFTPLLNATKKNHMKIVDLLIDKYGQDINEKGPYSFTLVHFAVHSNNIILLRSLVKRKVNINITSSFNKTPLYYAVQYDNEIITKELIKDGSDLNKTDYLNNTPLHIAVINQNVRIIKTLIDAQARIDIINNSGETPMEINDRLFGKNYLVIKSLLQSGSKEKTNKLNIHIRN